MRTYANTVTNKFVTETNGTAGAGALVTVYTAGSAVKAPLFDVLGAAITNPLSADDEGNYAFKVADGIYDLVINEGALSETRIDRLQIAEIIGFNADTAHYSDLATAQAANLTVSAIITTAGYYATNDGGEGQYVVVAGGTGPADGGSYLNMLNGNQLELINNGDVNPKAFGAKFDSSTDDTLSFQAANDYLVSKFGRGSLVLPPGYTRVGELDISGNIMIKGSGINSTVFEPSAAASGSYMIRLHDNYSGIVDCSFNHDRSFQLNAIEIFANANINRWITLNNLFITSISGAAVFFHNTVWESTFTQVHTRICGNNVSQTPVFNLATSATGDSTNNVTLDRCFIIFPHYIGVHFKGEATNVCRKIKITDCMFHGGTDEGDLTTFPYPFIQAEYAQHFDIHDNNLAFPDATVPTIVIGGDAVTRSQFVSIKNNKFGSSGSTGDGVSMTFCLDSEMDRNSMQANLLGTHLTADSTVLRLLVGQQLIDGGNPFIVSGSFIPQPFDDRLLEGPNIIGIPKIKGASNWAGEEFVTAATSAVIALPFTEVNAGYQVSVNTNFSSGGTYVTTKTTTSFTVNWPTSGTGAIWWWLTRA
jgi:hypothetical protein